MKQLLIIIAMLGPLKTMAQQNKLAGGWIINSDRTEWNGQSASQMPKAIQEDVKGDQISITRTFLIPQDSTEHSHTERVPFDGKPGLSTTYTGKKWSSVMSWNSDKTVYTERTTIKTADDKILMEVTDICSLSGDGERLIVDRHVVDLFDNYIYSIKGVYDRVKK